MDAIVTLRSSNERLEFEAVNKAWWRCYLISQDSRRLLGAANPEYIVSTLLDTLFVPWDKIEREVSGYMNGFLVKPSLILYERYSSLFIAADGNRRILLWWDGRGNLLCEMHVSQDDLREWHKQLLTIKAK